MTPKTFNEFFAGAGLARLGLEPAGWQCAWANDICPDKARLYKHSFPSTPFTLGDINEAAAQSSAPRAALSWASFPCQDLSLAGKGEGMAGEKSGAYWGFVKSIQTAKPDIVVLENVPGLLRGGWMEEVCAPLCALGMRFGAFVLDAAHFLPQSRKRVFVVAVRTEGVPEGQSGAGPTWWHPPGLIKAHAKMPATLKNAWIWWDAPRPKPRLLELKDILEEAPADPEEETRLLLGSMDDRNRAKVTRAIVEGVGFGFVYKRTRSGCVRAEVRFDGLAGCIRTPGGGSSIQKLLVLRAGRVSSRRLTASELARLMGIARQDFFPPGYPYMKAYRAMGDGVAVPVVRYIAHQILEPIIKLLTLSKEIPNDE